MTFILHPVCLQEETIGNASEAKKKGNAYFKAQDYDKAIEQYSEAIKLDKDKVETHIYYSNRSACYLAKGDFDNALKDANSSINANKTYSKAYDRKGSALWKLNEIDEAILTYKMGLQYDPDNKTLRENWKKLKQLKKAMAKLIHIQESDDLLKLLSKGKNDKKLIVIDFYATWCGPCKMIAPAFEQLCQIYKNEAIFVKIDVDKAQEIAMKYKIKAMPTFKIIKDENEIQSIQGANIQGVENAIKTHKY